VNNNAAIARALANEPRDPRRRTDRQPRQHNVAKVVHTLKALSKEHGVTVIVVTRDRGPRDATAAPGCATAR
jgi:ABC-type Fe3+/spermidine/putrescine transport system ATPase subunit